MSATPTKTRTASPRAASARKTGVREQAAQTTRDNICLLYTSDAADE